MDNLTILYNSLSIGALVLFVPTLFCLIFSSFGKLVNNKLTSTLIYSFMAGMMIIMSTFGLMKEGFESADEHYHAQGDWIPIMIVIGGVTIGLFTTLLIRFLIGKHSHEMHHHHDLHNHSDILYNISDVETKSSFWMVLISLMGHKVIAGISLGLFITGATGVFKFANMGLILITLIHMIPECILLFHKYYSISKSLWKSFLITFSAQFVVFTFILISAFLFEYIQQAHWLMPILFSISGGSILFVSVIDLVPEFIHNKNGSSKQWQWILIAFCIGTIFNYGTYTWRPWRTSSWTRSRYCNHELFRSLEWI